MEEFLTLIFVIITLITAMVLLNSLFTYLSERFPIGYNCFLIALVVISGLILVFTSVSSSGYAGVYILVNFVVYYFGVNGVTSSTDYSLEGEGYFDWLDRYHEKWKIEEHYMPAWLNKLIIIAVLILISYAITYVCNTSIVVTLLQLIFLVIMLIIHLRNRAYY